MTGFRPPHFWNFFDDAPEHEKVKHMLRYDADPKKCYEDGRIEKILENIEQIGMNLRSYEDKKWTRIRKQTYDVFHALDKKLKDKLNE